MSEQHPTRSNADKDNRQDHRAHSAPSTGGAPLAGESAPADPVYPGSLLENPSINGRGNGPVRVALMRSVQRTYGNRALQRRLGSKASVPVQRQDPDEDRSAHAPVGGSTAATSSTTTAEHPGAAPPGPGGQTPAAGTAGTVPGAATTPPGSPPPAPPAGGDTITFQGRQLSESVLFVRYQLEQLVLQQGDSALRSFVEAFEGSVTDARQQVGADDRVRRDLPRYGAGDVSGVPLPQEVAGPMRQDLDLRERILPVVRDQYESMRDSKRIAIEQFGPMALQVAREMLDESERRMRAELQHYGIDANIAPTMAADTRGQRSRRGEHAEDRRGLARAAREVLAKHREVEQAVASQPPLRRVAMAEPTGNPEFRASEARVRHLREEYTRLRMEREREFPILAAYTGEPGLAGLQHLASQPEAQSNFLQGEIVTRLANIETVRGQLGGRFDVWKQPRIVSATEQRMGMGQHDVRRVWVEEHARGVRADAEARELFTNLLTFALSLITLIPTGGLSAPAAMAVAGARVVQGVTSAALAADRYQEMSLEAAAGGTDFDRARAISQDEPGSMFWMALDVVGAIADVGDALRAFRTLAASFRSTRQSGDLVSFARTARSSVPDAAAANITRRVAHDAEAQAALVRWIEGVGTEFRQADMEDVIQRVRTLSSSAMGDVVQELNAAGRIRPLNMASLVRYLGYEGAREALNDIPGLLRNGGALYVPDRGMLFVSEGALDAVSSNVVHEAAHYLQHRFGGPGGLLGFQAEFDAYMAQRRYLLNVEAMVGPDAVPQEWRFLLGTDAEAVQRISVHLTNPPYNFTIPGAMDARAAVRRVMANTRRFSAAAQDIATSPPARAAALRGTFGLDAPPRIGFSGPGTSGSGP